MTFSNSPSSGVALQGGGGGSGGAGASAPLTGTGATVTTSQPLIDVSQTWNASGVTFTGMRFNAAGTSDANSAAASLLMDLQVGGASKFNIDKQGRANIRGVDPQLRIAYLNESQFIINQGILIAGNNYQFAWSSSLTGVTTGNADLILTRRGAANLRLGAADAAGSAIAVNSVASNQLTLASAHGLTNGAAVQVTFTGGGAVPAGTAVNTTYYARSISAAVLELYGTYDQAITTASTTGRVSVTTAGTTAFINRATPFQTLSVQSFTGTDIPGQPFVITGSQGTGTGAGGDIIFQVAPRGTTGSAQNALATALTIDTTGLSTFTNGTNRVVVDVTSTSSMAIRAYQAGFTVGSIAFNASTNNVAITPYANGDTLFAGPIAIGTAGGIDVRLFRDDANKLALRNGTAAQTFNLYLTHTDASNYSRLSFQGTTGAGGFGITSQAAGTGVLQPLRLVVAGFQNIYFDTNSTTRLFVDYDGHVGSGADNTKDFGVTTLGNRRFRNIYAGTSITPGAGVTVATLPTPTTGMIARVTDATAPTIGTTVVGGGAAYALVNYNGANWTVIGV